MPANCTWYVENHIIRVTVFGDVTLEDMNATMNNAAGLIDESSETLVHTLVDLSNLDHAPMRVQDRVDAVKPVLTHPRCGWVLIYGNDNPLANMISGTVAQIFRARFRTFKTQQQAITFLKDRVPNLPELPAIQP